MALSSNYYENLKTQLTSLAEAKKKAIDLRNEMYSTAAFDSSGKLTGYGEKGLGSRDVAQLESERRLGGVAEGAGMMRSGQYARDLATSQALYRADILGRRAEGTGEKQTIDYGLAKELAEAQAAYGPGTGGSTGGTGAGGGAGGAGAGSAAEDKKQEATPIEPVPVYVPPTDATSVISPGTKNRVTSPIPSTKFAPKKQAPQRTVPKTTTPAPPGRGGGTKYR